ncbi:uncharacterized protein BO80DRAFT_469554 [Aspergillus ibericus CBS 121593]|uniref:Cell wall protein n=1 Tax=Aspergillus ibericus CBS 121593 TaxID=1448316 RepID=A0A395GJ72_9EURO|nr:hypothetical protein BO80DRAFT_469554 [Aspergillus ibericus CBS 121593]RAK95256.1 hypothetical protein BO80DRAFT_469554 [Aspergillus ibericus CBS 121593]
MNLLPILLLFISTLLPLATALSSSTLQSCHSLNRLNTTIHRVSPLLEKLSTQTQPTTNTLSNGTSTTTTRSTTKLQSIQALLASSQEKIYGRLGNCSDETTSGPGSDVKRSDDDDDDDDDDCDCNLNDVLDQLVDTLECLVSFVTGLLGTILDGVFDLLEEVVRVVEGLLD